MTSRDLMTKIASCIALAFTGSFAVPADYWFETANAFYEQQAYDSAAAYYEKIVSSDAHNSAVFFNLGNTYFRQKKIGLAVLFYEKAHKLAPNDPDVLANIRFAQTAIVDKLPVPETSFVEAVLKYLHNLLPLPAQLWVLLFLLLSLSMLFAVGLYVSSNLRLWIIYLSSILLVVALCCGVSAGIKIYSNETMHYAVVLSASVDAKNQPNGNKVLFSVHEGIKFRVRKQLGDWSLVSLPTGVSGWVPTSSLGII